MHFVDLLTVLLCRNCFTRIQEAVMDETGGRPPNSHHNLFLVKFWFREVFWGFIVVQPLRGTSSIIVEDPFLIASYDSVKKRIILVALKKRR